MGNLKWAVAVAISLSFLMSVVVQPVSADGDLNSGSCATYNGTTFMVGYWNEKTDKGCTLYYQFEGYRDITAGSPNSIWEANVYLSPEDGGDHVIEDSERCSIIKFSSPLSGGQKTIFKSFSPNTGAHYGDSHTIYYTLGISGGASLESLGSIGADVAVSTSSTYWDTSVAVKSMTATKYEVHGDIDDKKDEARHFVAGCAMQTANVGTQSAMLFVEGSFEAQGWFGGTDTKITDLKTLSFYLT